jgi:uncharacterized membrane protein
MITPKLTKPPLVVKTKPEGLLLGVILAPVLYALWIYPSLPEQIPVHFDMRGTPDRYAAKSLFYFIILPIANVLLYYLIRYLAPLDRQKKIVDRFSFYLFRLSLAGCLSVLAWLITYQMVNPGSDLRLEAWMYSGMTILLGFLSYQMACLGPTAINSPLSTEMQRPEVWKKVRMDTGRIIPFSSLLVITLVWVLPSDMAMLVFFIYIISVSLFPLLYAYSVSGKMTSSKK